MKSRGESVLVRLHPVGATPTALAAQFRRPRRSTHAIALLRSLVGDPLALPLSALPLPTTIDDGSVETSWTVAQLAADVTLLGLGAGLRVVLVPDAGRWFADLVILRTGDRLRGSRGYRDPGRALVAAARSLRAAITTSSDRPEGVAR